jgi:hypothetical protein
MQKVHCHFLLKASIDIILFFRVFSLLKSSLSPSPRGTLHYRLLRFLDLRVDSHQYGSKFIINNHHLKLRIKIII